MTNPARDGRAPSDHSAGPVIWSGGFRRAAGFERVQQEQDNAQGDGGVRDVEGGPVPLAVVHVQEVDDVAVQDAVDEIAQRPAQHQRPGDGLAVPAGIQLAQPDGDEHAGDDGQDDEEPALPATGARKEAEGGALVAQIGELEERRQPRNQAALVRPSLRGLQAPGPETHRAQLGGFDGLPVPQAGPVRPRLDGLLWHLGLLPPDPRNRPVASPPGADVLLETGALRAHQGQESAELGGE